MLSRWAKIRCRATWSPYSVSGPNATWSMPTRSAQYWKWSMTESMVCRGCAADSVVCGAADIPITPPVAATARSTSSGFIRGISQTARAPAWVMNTGRSLCSQVSSAVRSPAWDRSMARPSLFIRVTARRPNAVSPESETSARPPPRELASE
jgi:hypothetical protein